MTTPRLLSAPTAPPWLPSWSMACSSDTTLVGSSSPVVRSKTLPVPRISPELLQRAEKMARMTNELSLHKLIIKMNSLERDMAQLAARTKDNEAFCRQHGERLEKLWPEMMAARARAESSIQLREEDRLDMKEHRREVVEVKTGLDTVRGLVEDLVAKMGTLPTLAEAKAVLAAVRTQREAAVAASSSCVRSDDKGGHDDEVRAGVRARIEETIRSTRRWHADHKTTGLTDGEFVARYLRKQARRDPAMAVCLQRAMWRRVRGRRRGGQRRPRSMEEFCRLVAWADVTGAVEDVLVGSRAGGAW